MQASPPNVDLPIIYGKARAWFATFPTPLPSVEMMMPDRELRPIQLWPGAGAVVVAVFDYQDTSIGSYCEVGIGTPCRYRGTTAIPILPLLAQRWLDDVGIWIETLPVTTELANDAGRAIWGYPKYVADIAVEADDQRMSCTVSEGGKIAMKIAIERPGPSRALRFPMRTYSKRDDELLRTDIDIEGRGVVKKRGVSASMTIERHPRTSMLRHIPNHMTRPIEVQWFDDYRCQLDRARERFAITAR